MAGAPVAGAPQTDSPGPPRPAGPVHETAGADTPTAVFAVETLAARPDFLRAARARRKALPAFLLQARDRADGSATVRVGFTCSKKVGNAVARNRAKRRLREAARLVLPGAARPGWDYVLVGFRDKTAERPFAALMDDLRNGLRGVHGAGRP